MPSMKFQAPFGSPLREGNAGMHTKRVRRPPCKAANGHSKQFPWDFHGVLFPIPR